MLTLTQVMTKATSKEHPTQVTYSPWLEQSFSGCFGQVSMVVQQKMEMHSREQ